MECLQLMGKGDGKEKSGQARKRGVETMPWVEIGEEREVVGRCILVGNRVSGIGLLALSGFVSPFV